MSIIGLGSATFYDDFFLLEIYHLFINMDRLHMCKIVALD